MPPGGGSTPGNIVDGDVPRHRRIIWRRTPPEVINPANLAFARRVAEIEANQLKELENQMAASLGPVHIIQLIDPLQSFWVGDGQNEPLLGPPPSNYRSSFPHLPVEHGESPWNDPFDIPGTSMPQLLKDDSQQSGQLLKDSAKQPDDTDFLDGTYFKMKLDKQNATARNKKSSKKQKKKKGKGKGKGRKESHASEMQCKGPTEPSSSCAAATSGETLASSSSRVAIDVPLLEYCSSSSSSHVTEKLIITPAVNSASSGNEKELSASSCNDDFKSFKSTSSYATAASSSVNDYYTGGKAWNNTMGDYAGSLSDTRSERSLSTSDSTDSRGFKKTSGEGNKPNVHQSLAIGPGCCQEALLCSDYASNDGDFQKVISRRSAKKMKKMQRLESPAPSSTMAASGSIVTRAPVPRAPFREVITIGHYLNDDTFYGRKPNQKKGKYQKARSLSNLSKTSYTDGDNVSDSNTTMLVTTTVNQAKPSSSRTLEAIEKTNSPSCLSKEAELKTTAAVGDGIEDTDSKAQSSDKSLILGSLANSSCANKEEHKEAVDLVVGDTEDIRAPFSDYRSSLGHLDNTLCVDREEQKTAMAVIGVDTGGTRAPSSDKTSSLSHLVNSSCVDMEEPKKKSMALVGGGTEDIGSRAPTSDKTSPPGLLVDCSSCVDRQEQEKAMSPVGGDTKDTDSRAVTSDKTLSLCHLAISSCGDSEEQKKEDNRTAFSTPGSSELDKIIEAANNAYEIQASSDVYRFSGVHANIENFLHAATPVIGQISCTKTNISLQDQRLWSVWRWYQQAECCGIEVKMQGKKNSIWPEFSTYFQPLLSAVQLFGQSGKSQNQGGLVFEYFELLENPFSRPPIFTKIKQLRDGVNLSGNPIFGDPKQLESLKLSDLHPASWFCVAWYPICQIPETTGTCQASFLTYHSLGKLIAPTCSMDKADGHDRIICPIVGLLGYKDLGEKWLQLPEQLRFKQRPNVSSEADHAELLKKRLRTLRQGASIMSKALVPKASGETMNYHSDYEFFCSNKSR